jgi:hypothetical protein
MQHYPGEMHHTPSPRGRQEAAVSERLAAVDHFFGLSSPFLDAGKPRAKVRVIRVPHCIPALRRQGLFAWVEVGRPRPTIVGRVCRHHFGTCRQRSTDIHPCRRLCRRDHGMQCLRGKLRIPAPNPFPRFRGGGWICMRDHPCGVRLGGSFPPLLFVFAFYSLPHHRRDVCP